jgi:hypothetical protein
VRLLRHALEAAIDAFWETTRPGEVAGCGGRGRQIRLLAAVIDRQRAHEVYATWCMLSDAAKPHPYELGPTVGELRALQAATKRHVTALADARRDTVSSGHASDACHTARTGTALPA